MHALTRAKLELLKQLVTVYLNLAQGNSPAPAVKEFIHKPIKKKKRKKHQKPDQCNDYESCFKKIK